MKTLFMIAVMLGALIQVSCTNTNTNPPPQKIPVVVEKIKLIKLDNGITAEIFRYTKNYNRVKLSAKTDLESLRSIAEKLKIDSTIVYFHVEGHQAEGSEFASMINKNIIFLQSKYGSESIKQRIKKINNFAGEGYRSSVPDIMKELDILNTEIMFLQDVKTMDEDDGRTIPLLEKAIKDLQRSEFPQMRKAYINISKNLLWENDIKVTGNGTTISYTGGVFVSNKNKKDFYETISTVLYKLRFKRANFKWYEYDDTYTYYTIDSPKDTEVTN